MSSRLYFDRIAKFINVGLKVLDLKRIINGVEKRSKMLSSSVQFRGILFTSNLRFAMFEATQISVLFAY